ncbi:MAG: oligosaccharyl transferase, archaeosortase A system-associated [Methanoregula sp.]|nr:oligosaccharyl transferase, archaeosortase A system-associated [Methanoregula sp.]
MVQPGIIQYKKFGIAVLVLVFALFALWIRLIPMFNMGNTDILEMVAMDDPLYNLRQVEVMLAQFPGYAWFEPMTLFPTGTTIYWGPLFPTIIAIFCLATGAATRPGIISVALLVPPLLAAATVVVMYFTGRVFGDWKTGILASGFTAIVAGQFLAVSFYGYIDHHIAEVLFSTIFCLAYGYTLLSEKERKIDFSDSCSYRQTIFLSLLCGIAYLLGLFVMPTMILFAMIVAVFTAVQFIIDFSRNRSSDYLLVINGITFLVAIIGLLVFGFKSTLVDLSTYSVGHIYAYLGLIGGTLMLWYLARLLRGKKWYYYPGVLAGTGILTSLLLFALSPSLFTLFVYGLYAFFGQQAITNTVLEAMGWSAERAWYSFNYGLLLLAGGILVVLYNNFREEHPHHIFALTWALVMLISTWQHIRYEYYLAICIALLAAICVSFVIGLVWRDYPGLVPGTFRDEGAGKVTAEEINAPSRKKPAKHARKKAAQSSPSAYSGTVLAVLVLGFSLLFAYTSVSASYTNMAGTGSLMNADWKEALVWMGNNTPDPGVDYLTIHDPKTFRYPGQSYGVMSWWDYGHMITYIAKRIPNANPFQQGVAGPDGSAAYFVAPSEDTANKILDHVGTRYVVTDFAMADIVTGKFHAMATWYNTSARTAPFLAQFYIQNPNTAGRYEPAMFIRQEYYLTMVSRLHNFDGSMTDPSMVYYVEYADPALTGAPMPVIIGGSQINSTEARLKVVQYNANATSGRHAAVFNRGLTGPVESVPALQHYRLVHESPTNVYGSAATDVKNVKVFEYVKGAHIKGSGIISVPVVTNTGRHFTWRQESINSEFVVPFSTTGNRYGVKTEGQYRIEGTGQTFDVPESAVVEGTAIN